MYSREQLAEDLLRLGVAAGDTVMLHASVRAVGKIAGGPDQIHLALKEVLTPDGTLMMYASCPEYYDEVGRGQLTASQEQEIREKLPTFDARWDRAQRDNGALVELFRTSPGVHVNNHVARFVVWGKQSDHMLSQQPWDYPFGINSPLDRFVQGGGRVLLLGSDHDAVTVLHYAEHIADIPDKRIARFEVPVLEDGARVWKTMEEFDTSDRGAHPHWPARFFARLTNSYLKSTGNEGGRVGDARSHLFSALGLVEFALPLMMVIASDAAAARDMLEDDGV